MKSYNEYKEQLNEAAKKPEPKKPAKKKAEKDQSSGRVKGMHALVDTLRKFFDGYDLPTRKFLWEKLTSAHGKELVERMLRSPKTLVNDSQFVQLVTKK
jgi:hypothetical protein